MIMQQAYFITGGCGFIGSNFIKYLFHKNKNIRVNSISPGGILDQQPQSFLDKYRDSCTSKGMLDPTDVAGTVLFLFSDQSKYINGQNIVIDDGWSL